MIDSRSARSELGQLATVTSSHSCHLPSQLGHSFYKLHNSASLHPHRGTTTTNGSTNERSSKKGRARVIRCPQNVSTTLFSCPLHSSLQPLGRSGTLTGSPSLLGCHPSCEAEPPRRTDRADWTIQRVVNYNQHIPARPARHPGDSTQLYQARRRLRPA